MGGQAVSQVIANIDCFGGLMATFFQSEKDIVFIVADKENRLDIMKSIGEKCGMHSEAKGILVSLPIDRVIGFESAE